MATIGLSKPYYAVYSNTGTTVSYANGGVMGKATEANIEVETTEDNNLYADNSIAETDEDASELIYDDTQETPYLGTGFIIKKKVGGVYKWRAVVLTKVMFGIPSDAATTQGETIEWQVPELSATILRDDSANHVWKREATFTSEAQAEAYIKDRLSIQ